MGQCSIEIDSLIIKIFSESSLSHQSAASSTEINY